MKPEAIFFERSEWVPNNPDLPVLLYKSTVLTGDDPAAALEQRFRNNGWQGTWRNGVFSYQHYHTHAHEVLGVAAGAARLLIGGPTGREFAVSTGDCLVLPAGTGHRRLAASSDFLVVGAYPPGQHADIRTGEPGEEGLRAIAAVPLPASDPVEGEDGPLRLIWASG
ncbi:MAG: Double-stranded beta helix protein [Rhizobium sp.]|nr:Double-stranded beta helix protein [Rhizobium sp.]